MYVNVERMISARKATGLKQAEFARRCGISYVSLYRIERGRQCPRADLLGRWAKACGVDVGDLYTKTKTEAA